MGSLGIMELTFFLFRLLIISTASNVRKNNTKLQYDYLQVKSDKFIVIITRLEKGAFMQLEPHRGFSHILQSNYFS